ncbi:MAG: glycosyl hydrolase family 28-related protein [Verrucomicrobiota bacterium]
MPVIAYDVVVDYGADNLGQTDATEIFQEALDDAEEHGGTVFAPAGRYLFKGQLSIPPGVTLRGDWYEPTPENPRVAGTVIMATADRGNETGKAFITVQNGGSLRDFNIVYPQQQISDIQPYPVTVLLGHNSTVKNMNLVNPYVGIQTESFSTVLNIFGSPLKTGIVMLKAGAVPRCSRINLSPFYWSRSGFPAAPDIEELRAAIADEGGYGIQLNRQDAGIFVDVMIDRYQTGIKFMPPHGWTYWHDLRITNAEVGIHFTGGSDHRAYITGSYVHATRHSILMQMDKTGWKDNWIRHSKSGKAYGTSSDGAELRLFGCRFQSEGTAIYLDGSFDQVMDIQECIFDGWGSEPNHYAVYAKKGSIDIYDSYFQQSGRHLYYEGKKPALKVVGNTFKGSPDLKIPPEAQAGVDHSIVRASDAAIKPLQPIPERLPARTGIDSLYLVTDSPFSVPSDGVGDATAGIQRALDAAGRAGGGTVYLPQGRFRITSHLKVPPGVELRGVNDSMPRPDSGRTMLVADVPQDMGQIGNPPLISLESSPELGGSGVAGMMIWYPHQDFRDIQPYPWTIRALGPDCWVQRLYLGNCYNAIDFGTNNTDRHVLSRVNGSALNIGFFVANTPTVGWINNCHLRPQDWYLATGKHRIHTFPGENKPTREDVFRGKPHSLIPNLRGSGAITIGSGANAQITGFFTNGSTRAFDFIDHDGTGGGNANILIGGSEAGWGSWVKAVGDEGATFVNFSINPMTRLPYIKPEDIPEDNLPKGMVMRVDPSVSNKEKINFIISKFYGRAEVDYGFDIQGGTVSFKQMEQEHDYVKAAVNIDGGTFLERNINIGKIAGAR